MGCLQTVMGATYANLDICLKQQFTGNENTDVGKCILTAAKTPCIDFVQVHITAVKRNVSVYII